MIEKKENKTIITKNVTAAMINQQVSMNQILNQ